MAGPADMSELHAALDRLRPQLCHCGLKGECLGCKGIEMIRVQAEAVVAAASQPILLQVAQEASMKDMATRFEAMSERLLSDPEIRRSAEDMQQRLMSDPETRQLLEELMRRLGAPPEEGRATSAAPPDRYRSSRCGASCGKAGRGCSSPGWARRPPSTLV